MNSYCYHVLIVGDSRVRQLYGELSATTLNIEFHIRPLSGARMDQIALKAVTELAYWDGYHLVILAGGINNLSKLFWHSGRYAGPRYKSTNQLVEYTLREMRAGVQKVRAFTSVPVALASMAGMDLVKYSPWHYDKLYHLQPLIDLATVRINLQIRGINRSNSLLTPDLSSATNRCCGRGGRYRSHYTYLIDGLHPGFNLRRIWAANIVRYCMCLFPEVIHQQEELLLAKSPPQSRYGTDAYTAPTASSAFLLPPRCCMATGGRYG